jgi:hypothetical protein
MVFTRAKTCSAKKQYGVGKSMFVIDVIDVPFLFLYLFTNHKGIPYFKH